VERLVGTWNFGCASNGSGFSARREYVFSRIGPASVSLLMQAAQFLGNDCTGASNGSSSDVYPLTYELTGMRALPDSQVTFAAMVSGPGTGFGYKQILLLRSDGRLFFGDTAGGKDADGYPMTLVETLSGSR
jgi:hypothetical protein